MLSAFYALLSGEAEARLAAEGVTSCVMTDKTQLDPEETADGTSYREEAGGGDRDLGDADGTSYREIAKEDDADDERSSAD